MFKNKKSEQSHSVILQLPLKRFIIAIIWYWHASTCTLNTEKWYEQFSEDARQLSDFA